LRAIPVVPPSEVDFAGSLFTLHADCNVGDEFIAAFTKIFELGASLS
jgi:hypothetical protein